MRRIRMVAPRTLHSTNDSGRAWEYLSDPVAAQNVVRQMDQVMDAALKEKEKFQSLEDFQQFAEAFTAKSNAPVAVEIHTYRGKPELLFSIKDRPDEKTISPYLSIQAGGDPSSHDFSARTVMEKLGIEFVTNQDVSQGNQVPGQSQSQPSTLVEGLANAGAKVAHAGAQAVHAGRTTLDTAADAASTASQRVLQSQHGILTGVDLLAAGAGSASLGVKAGITLGAAGVKLSQQIVGHINANTQNAQVKRSLDRVVGKIRGVDDRTQDLSERAEALGDSTSSEPESSPNEPNEAAIASCLEKMDAIERRTEEFEKRANDLLIPESVTPPADSKDKNAPADSKDKEASQANGKKRTNPADVEPPDTLDKAAVPVLGDVTQKLGDKVNQLVDRIAPGDEVTSKSKFTPDRNAPLQEQLKQIESYLDHLTKRLDRLEITLNRLERKDEPINRPVDSPLIERADETPTSSKPGVHQQSAEQLQDLLPSEAKQKEPAEKPTTRKEKGQSAGVASEAQLLSSPPPSQETEAQSSHTGKEQAELGTLPEDSADATDAKKAWTTAPKRTIKSTNLEL